MKIYFAGSIRGGRGMAADYNLLISSLGEKHTVLTEHIGDAYLSSSGEKKSEGFISNKMV